MALHRQKEDVLLAWINSLRLGNPVKSILLLHDGILLLRLICKLKGQEVEGQLDQPIQERFEFISGFLKMHCQNKERGDIISWVNILNGKDLDMELSKVVVLLMCHTIANELLVTDELDRKTEIQMAAVLRFVLHNEDSLHQSENLTEFLQKPFTIGLPSDSSPTSFSYESPVLKRSRTSEVKFLELMTVASSSARSPIQEVLNTPIFQLRKVHKQLAEERDMRDEVERELSSTSQLLAERELQISQLQHRIQRLMRDSAEHDQEPKVQEQLQSKIEGLQKHLHEVIKQCQDLKTDKGQMEKKVDQLTEENGNLSVNIRDMVARLSSAQTMVDTLSEEQQASQAEWESKKMFFETELCQAASEKESLSEQIQILRGKISILEDELTKAQTQERGEVMGPIMERERLNHEISELTCKLLQLQETILQLEKEKQAMQTKHEMEKNKFESETSHLQGLISELQETTCVLRSERETLEQISREQQATMTAQISAMNAEIARLSEMIHQKELAATVLNQQVAEEQKRKEILMENMEKQDRINQGTIQGLSQQVEHLETTLKSKEVESSHQQAILQEASRSAMQERDTILVEYHQFRLAKEEEALNLNKHVRQLEEQRELELSLLSDLRREKEELHLKLISLETAIRDLQNELEVESRKHRETLAAKHLKHSQMESEINELGNRVQQLLTDIKLMGQQLNEAQQEKRLAESCVEELKIECRELSNALSAERDRSLHLVKEREAEVEMLSANVQTKTEEVEKLAKETEQYLVELEATRTAKTHVESHLNSVTEKHQAEICAFHLELTNVRELVKQKEAELEEKVAQLQAQVLEASTLASGKELELCTLRSEFKENENLRLNAAETEAAQRRELEEKVAQLQAQVLEVSTLASGKELELCTLRSELKENENLRLNAAETEAAQRRELEEKVAQLQAQVLEASTLASGKELELCTLRSELKENENSRLKAAETEAAQRRELEEKVAQLQAQVLEASTLASGKELELCTLHSELKENENLRLNTAETEAAQRRELEEKVAQLQAQVLEASTLASGKELELCTLRGELKENENLRLSTAETEAAQRRELEEKVAQLQAQVLEASTLASGKELELCTLHSELKENENLRLNAAETEAAQRRELEEKVAQLQAQVLEASTLASGKELELCTLRGELKENENLRLNTAETEAAQRRELEEKVAQLQAQVLEASTLASGKELELCTLRSELKENENSRLNAAETEAAQRRELEEKVAQLQAQVLEASTLASGKELELCTLHSEFKENENLRLNTAETEAAQRRELEEKVAQLQAQVLEASTLASGKELELCTLRGELKENENLRLNTAETEAAQRRELEEKLAQLQAQVLEASTLASGKELELCTLRGELKENENLRLNAAETEAAQRGELEEKVAQLQAQVLEASTLASGKELELCTLRGELKENENLRLNAAETEAAQHRELEEKVAQLQAQVLEASTLASGKELELCTLHSEFKERENLRLNAAETEAAQRRELEEKVAQLQAQVLETSTLASGKELELCTLHSELKENKNLRLNAAETEAAQRRELEEKVAQLQAQVLEASTLASGKELELCTLRSELKENENLRLNAAETEAAQRRELEEKLAQLQAQVLEASTNASLRESELHSLHCEVKDRDNLRLQVAETEEAQRKALEVMVSHLQAQVLEASTLASERELEKENLRLQVAEARETQRRELEQKLIRVHEELQRASSLVIQKQQINETLKEELRKRDVCQEEDVLRSHAEELNRKAMEETIDNLKAKLLSAATQEENATKLQQQITALRHTNEELLAIREGSQKEREVSQKLTEDLATQLQLAREELSALRPLRGAMAEGSQLNSDLQEQLSLKSEALEHYKAQVENAKIHYNGKKQLLLEANENIQALTTALETKEQEVKTHTEQIQVLQQELEQARDKGKNLVFNNNSLQAQLDYAVKELREQKRLAKCEELKPKETVYQRVSEKQQDTSGGSLDLSLEDSLNSTRRPSNMEESSTPVPRRSSERLQAKRRAPGGESLETLYFTPMSLRNAVDGKLESSITSLGELVLDSAKTSRSARRRTTQVINITMTKKTPGRVEAEAEDSFTSALSLQSAQSFPNLANQRCRPFSLDFSEEATTSDQLQHLPGYRRSAVHSVAPTRTRSISTFGVGAENEPDHSEDWMRIAELQARNKACLPHLKSSYPIESRPSLGIPSFTITDEDLKLGDPDETIRRASMMPSQITDSLASHRLSMLPGQFHDGPLSRRETMLPGDIGSRAAAQHAALQPKRGARNVQNTRAATLPLKRAGCDLPGPDTPETKKLVSCFPRPMTPKDRNDRRFASQNSQNQPPNTPVDRRQSMMFSIENTPKKTGKSSLLQKGINKMRASTRKTPGSTSKIPRTTKSPRGEKPQRRSPRISTNKSPKIASSARKLMNYRPRMKM